ncbi:MAG TPA: UTP--glucose-1-phosphate uridylyltransferase [Rectinemataceae bacterium]
MKITPELEADMISKGIDIGLSLELLEAYNSGRYDAFTSVRASGVPKIDGKTVVDLRGEHGFSFPAEQAIERLSSLGIDLPESLKTARSADGTKFVFFSREEAQAIGLRLFSKTAYGVLNGGSATSYADRKKNLAFGSEVFRVLEKPFEHLAPLCAEKPKGVTPAYICPDGSPGASFLELKMRARLLLSLRSGRKAEDRGNFLPLFEMTSSSNGPQLSAHYEEARRGEYLFELSSLAGLEPADWMGASQSLICAFTHSSEGRPKRIFSRAFGKPDSSLALPGGHGQCFRVLAPILSALRDSGIRFAFIGNVDNLGYIPDPLDLAVLALSGEPAAFEFSARTPMDIKGGILVRTADGRKVVADIGQAIDLSTVLELEKTGETILFNCATGLFDLDYLVPRLDAIALDLPLRFSDQDKDAGKYSQAEQSAWEVTGILPSFLALVVEKKKRFLAAKLLSDTLLTSGVGLDEPPLPSGIQALAKELNTGLFDLLSKAYGLKLEHGRWIASP